MGDKSPQKEIKIGNLIVKLNPNNQQKKRDPNYDRNYYYKKNDRFNDRNTDKYNDRDRRREKENDRERDRERSKYQYDNKNYNTKKNEYENRKDKHSRNYTNRSNSNSRSGSRRKHSSHRNNNRSRSRTHSHHKNKNTHNDNFNTNINTKANINANNNIQNNNNNNNLSGSVNNNNMNMQNEQNNTNNNGNNLNNNMGFMNQFNQNFFNNYINNEFFKRFYSMNNRAGNPNTNNIIVPIGIPMNYFYNPNMANMNQLNKPNNTNNTFNQNQNQNTNNVNYNNQNQNQSQTQTQNKQQQKEEPSNTILITDLDTNITKETLEDIFREKCLRLQISMPVDIRLIEALNIAYIMFPSVTSCVIVYNSLLNQKILINGKYFPIQFSPNLTSKYNNNRDTLTYVTQISSNTSLTTSMETTVHEDWYCVYCDSKNFSRRTVCFKCQKPKSINCRVVPVIKQKKIILGANGEILPNNSIIIQGKQIQYSNEGEVLIFLLI